MGVNRDWFSPEASLLGLPMAAHSLCPRMVFPLSVVIAGVSLCRQISSSYKDTSWIRTHPNGLILT